MSKHHELTVRRVIEETAAARSFVLSVPPELDDVFAYRAGQFLTIEVPWQDFYVRRSYSLSSAPGSGEDLQFTVKRVVDGRVSNHLIDEVSAGDSLRVRAPEGRFVLNPNAGTAPLTFFAGGSGITPVYSLIKHALSATDRHIKLLYANRSPDSVIFGDALRGLVVTSSSRFELVEHLDDRDGSLSRDRIALEFRGREHGEFYVCGPSAFMDVVEQALDDESVAGDRRHFERFSSPVDLDRRDRGATVEIVGTPEVLTLRIAGRAVDASYERGQTLLAAARAAGIDAPSSCEDGFCGACMAMLCSGTTHMKVRDALTDAEVERGMVLTCQAVAVTDEPIVVDYDAASFKLPVLEGTGMTGRVYPVAALLSFAVIVAAIIILRVTA